MEVSFCKTLSFDIEDFKYETVSEKNGKAVMIKFPIDESRYSPGDVLLVLKGSEVVFHGLIRSIENGFGFASDSRGSLLPANSNW